MKIVALFLVAACASSVQRDQREKELLAKLDEFKQRACACTDKLCAMKVQALMTTWSEQQAKDASSTVSPSEHLVAQMTETTQAITTCLTDAGQVEPGETRPPAQPIFDADQIVKLSFDQHGPYVVAELVLAYIDAKGQADRTYGRIDVTYGRLKPPDPADDPKRPIGAPVEEKPLDPEIASYKCPHYVWQAGKRDRQNAPCLAEHALDRPRCRVVDIWQKALKMGDPAQGLAKLALVPTDVANDKPQHWTFRIDDEPRKIHVAHEFPDDCQPIVEKP